MSLARRAREYRRLIEVTEAFGELVPAPESVPEPHSPVVDDHLRRIEAQMNALATQLDAIPRER